MLEPWIERTKVESDVAGMLALGLGFSETGSCAAFQQALCRIFSRKMVIYYSTPPTTAGSRASAYQQHVMDLFLPISGVDASYAKLNRKRRYVVSYLLNGDWETTSEIPHFCIHGCCFSSEATMKCFAMYLTWALCPRQIPIFPRSRWTQYDRCVDACGILAATHGLLEDVVLEMTGGPMRPPPVEQTGESSLQGALADDDGGDSWDEGFRQELQPRAVAGASAQAADAGCNPQKPEEEPAADFSDYAKIKKQNKAKAKLWVQSKPLERLVLIKEVFFILLSLMYHFLDISGKAFERRQRILAATGQLRSYTILEAATGRELRDHMRRLAGLLWAAPRAIASVSYTARLKAKRFTMTACALSSLHCLLLVPRRGFPYKLFTLLTGGQQAARGILAERSCMHDALAHVILKEFDPLLK